MKKIYFVHDQQESPAARQNFLEMSGYEVRLMSSHRELLVALKEEAPALPLLDVLIEGLNGFEVAQKLNEKLPHRSFPMVICSRIYRTRQFREAALRAGVADYVLLPVQLDEFLRRINKVLEEWIPAEQGELDTKVA